VDLSFGKDLGRKNLHVVPRVRVFWDKWGGTEIDLSQNTITLEVQFLE
jgi:hypothetical protein